MSEEEIRERIKREHGAEAVEQMTAFLEELMGKKEEKPPDLGVSVSDGVSTKDGLV